MTQINTDVVQKIKLQASPRFGFQRNSKQIKGIQAKVKKLAMNTEQQAKGYGHKKAQRAQKNKPRNTLNTRKEDMNCTPFHEWDARSFLCVLRQEADAAESEQINRWHP